MVEYKYAYNEKRNTLHIIGLCCHTKPNPVGMKLFITENDALAYGGRAVGMCKICQKKREDTAK